MTPGPYRDGLVRVRADQCDRCLFGPDRLVDGRRAREIVADARATEGGSFLCHRSQIHDEPVAICATYFDRFADEDWILSLAKRLGIVRRVAAEHTENDRIMCAGGMVSAHAPRHTQQSAP
jgi:hypothetical protein